MSRVNPVCILGCGEEFYVEAPKKIVLLGKTIKKVGTLPAIPLTKDAGRALMVNVSITHSYSMIKSI